MFKSNQLNRVAALKKQLAGLDYVCSGNLRRRYTVCGIKNCMCQDKRPRPHGPYYYWSRLIDSKIVQRVLSVEQAKLVGKGISNYRRARELLRKLEAETVRVIEAKKSVTR
jgi:hypothetical protein